jgi:glycosyltransferase involved in cell wall biosynthesis
MNNMKKRALLVAFHFPPQAGSSGIQRTLSFSKHLGRHGWEPMVLSAHPRAYDIQNPSQLASIPSDLIVKRAFALDVKRHIGIKDRYPGLLAMPDRWSSWLLGAVPAGLSLIRKHRPQVIWTTFPIATASLIGLVLHRLTGLPWIADLRDPMLQSTYPTVKLQRKAFGWIEAQTLKHCTLAVCTTHSAMQAYRTRFPELADKFRVIENGYDEDGLSAQGASSTAAVPPANRPITLLHSGMLYETGRNPSAFLRALATLKHEGKVSAASLRIVLRAPGDVEPIEKMMRELDLGDIVEIAPAIPYREALREMLAADGLMIFQGKHYNAQIPAKIYEYFWARRPVLGLVDAAGETAHVLRAAGFDSMAAMDQPDAIAKALEQFLTQIRNGTAYVATPEVVAQSSRANRARQLADVFDEVTACAVKPEPVLENL